MPHPPNGLTSSGDKLPYNNKLSEKENENRYTDEIMFVNKRIRTIVDTLTKNTKRPMVIIMQGDHGYRFWKDGREQDEFPNFSAVYFSNKDYSMVPDTLSNVNLFKAVLNTFFHQNIPFDTNKQFFLHYR
jgi:hypothetical protein